MHKNLSGVTFPLLGSLTVSGILIFSHNQVLAQVTPDNTLGDESSVVNSRDDTSESIEGGAVRGENLFHSFEEFNVGEDRGVYFANPDAVNNIFSRVTGDNVSNILGTLGVDGAANLYLINPNGIVFGEGASLDVQGSFTATTADGIEFGEQGFFSVSDPEAPKLLTINPSAYLFNQAAPGAIANNSKASADFNPDTSFDDSFFGLRVSDDQNLLLLGGDLKTDGGGLVASGGRIDLGAIAGEGVVGLNANGSLNIPDGISRGDVSLTNGAGFLVAGDGGGDIAIAAKDISLDSASITAGIYSNLDSPNAQAGDLIINATDNITVDNSRVANEVNLETVGNAGDIFINAGSFQVLNGSQIGSPTFGKGDGGNVTVRASNIELAGTSSDGLLNSGLFTTVTGSQAQGNGGNLTISTDSLSLSDRAEISASTSGEGDSGNLSITANNSISLDASSYITNSVQDANAVGNAGKININTGSLSATKGSQINSFTRGQGNAGDITIQATDAVTFDGVGNGDYSGLTSSVEADGEGNGGNINITASSLSLSSAGFLEAGVREALDSDSLPGGQGKGGNVEINVDDTLIIANGGYISATLGTGAIGNAGNIDIQAGNLIIRDGGQITSSTLGQGDSGNIVITANNSISLDASSYIANNVEDINAIGNAGNISITTGSLSATNSGVISSSTFGKGNAGNITIQATDKVTFDSFNANYSGALSSVGTDAVGNGGNIDIQAENLIIRDSAFITSSTLGQGDSGNISITTDSLSATNTGIISSATFSEGNAGNISITTGSLSAINGGIISSGTVGQGNAGDITIQATDTVTFDGFNGNFNSSALSSVKAGALGDGGNIKLTASSLFLTNGGQLEASTFGEGDSGNVSITADNAVSLDSSSYILNNVQDINAKGDAGKIDITTGSLSATNGSQISSFTRGQGNAGDITIQATDAITFDGFDTDSNEFASSIASSVQAGGIGDGGNIKITADSLSLTNGGYLEVSVREARDKLSGGQGKGGNVNISVDSTLTIAGENTLGIFASLGSGAEGSGGDIRIKAKDLLIQDGGVIDSSSSGQGNSGNVDITLDNTLEAIDGRIFTNSIESFGGAISITASDINLRGDSDISTNVFNGAGGGGDINIIADSIITFDDSDIFAFAKDGRGGDINLDTPAFFAENFTLNSLTSNPDTLDLNSRADVNATGSVSGSVSIPDVNFIQNSLNNLPGNSINTDELVANSCVVPVGDRKKGKFVITGTESLPVRPGDGMPSKYPTGEVRNLPENNHSSWRLGDPIVEAQGAYRLANGKLVLSRQCSQ